MRILRMGMWAALLAIAPTQSLARTEPAQGNKAGGQQQQAGQAANTPRASVAEFDIACKYRNQTYNIHGKTILPASPPGQPARFLTAYQPEPANDLDYLFPTGICADLCDYFNPFTVRPPEGADASRLKTLPSETIGGVACRVVEMLTPDPPPEQQFGRGVPLLPRVRLRWYLSASGQTRRMTGEFQLFKPDGRTIDPNLLVMDATFTLREPKGSPIRAASGPPLRVFDVGLDDKSMVLAILATRDAPLLAVAPSTGGVTLWNSDTRQAVSSLAGSIGWPRSLTGSPDGRRVSVPGDKTIPIWDTASGKQTQTLGADLKGFRGMAFSPDGHLLAAGIAHDNNQAAVAVWNVETGKIVADASNVYGERLAFSPDGKMLAALSNSEIHLWDTSTWQMRTLANLGNENWASMGGSLAFSPDSRLLAVGDQRGFGMAAGFLNSGQSLNPDSATTVQIWDVQTGRRIQVLQGTTGPVLSLAFSPDGKMLAVVDRDTSLEGQGANSAVLLWDTQTWKQIGVTAVEHGRPIDRMAWTANSAALVTSYGDRTIKFWSVPR